MTLKILKEKENPLFKRKEISFELPSEITPSNKEVLELISKKLSVSKEAIKIKKIYGRFGSKNFIIDVNAYSTKENKEEVERKTKKEIEAEIKEAEAAKAAKTVAKAEQEAKKAAEEQKKAEETQKEKTIENKE